MKYKIYIDGECSCQLTKEFAAKWLTDFFGADKVDHMFKKLDAGETVKLSKKSEMRI